MNAIAAHTWNYGDLSLGFICAGIAAGVIFALAVLAHLRHLRKHKELHSALNRQGDEFRWQLARLGRKIGNLRENTRAKPGAGRRENQLIEDMSRILSPQ